MSETKAKTPPVKVKDFLATVKNKRRYEDALVLLKIMRKVTGKREKMWGPSIIGFDLYHY